jgi:hypothetical protein
MFVCIDKITCARMHQRIIPRWRVKAALVRAESEAKRTEAAAAGDESRRARLAEAAGKLRAQADCLDETIVERSGPGDCLSESRKGVLMDTGPVVRIRSGLPNFETALGQGQ